MRPANIVTAFADILAGYAAAGGAIFISEGALSFTHEGLGWLLVSTFGLYGGGVVFNDVFDAELDAEERPERPIPSGRASKWGAILAGATLLFVGVFAAFQVNRYAGFLAIAIGCGALLYDYRAKHSALWGPLFMGGCRGGNLLLGATIIPVSLSGLWFLAFLPVAYIGAITLVSQGEVHGGDKKSGLAALGLIILVTICLFILGLLPGYRVWTASLFIMLFALMVIPPFWRAAFQPEPYLIKKAIRQGVLSLILLNAAIAAGFDGFLAGIIVALLLPLSLLLAKIFAVT